jgi:hypothetical protein
MAFMPPNVPPTPGTATGLATGDRQNPSNLSSYVVICWHSTVGPARRRDLDAGSIPAFHKILRQLRPQPSWKPRTRCGVCIAPQRCPSKMLAYVGICWHRISLFDETKPIEPAGACRPTPPDIKSGGDDGRRLRRQHLPSPPGADPGVRSAFDETKPFPTKMSANVIICHHPRRNSGSPSLREQLGNIWCRRSGFKAPPHRDETKPPLSRFPGFG